MIGSALKKMAKENNMQVAHGVAYGTYRGFALTMCEGSGWKRLDFSTRISDPAAENALKVKLGEVDLKRTYRVQSLEVGSRMITVVFLDNPGTMKKIQAFLDWFMPLLEESGATKADICNECGMATVGDDCWVLIDGVAHHMHAACKEAVKRELAQDEQIRKEESTGSYLTGALGAIGGALIGAIVWALVLMLGYVASLVGLLIGFLAEKGYNLAKGKQDKGKIAVLVIAIVLGVLAGTVLADGISLAQMIASGELYEVTYGEIPMLILFLLMEDAQYLSATVSNCGMGLLFAGLGVFGILRKTKKEVTGIRVMDL